MLEPVWTKTRKITCNWLSAYYVKESATFSVDGVLAKVSTDLSHFRSQHAKDLLRSEMWPVNLVNTHYDLITAYLLTEQFTLVPFNNAKGADVDQLSGIHEIIFFHLTCTSQCINLRFVRLILLGCPYRQRITTA